MQKINCEITAHSNFEHLQQVFTGFYLLKRQGLINLTQKIKKVPHELFREVHTKVEINGKTVYYDMHDCGVILPQYMEGVDFYFKRSYSPKMIAELPEDKQKLVYPFGFNYQVLADGFDSLLLQRATFYQGKEKLKRIINGFGFRKTATLNNLEAKPDFRTEPKVLFMARAWSDVDHKKQSNLAEQISRERAECIRALRKEFGKRFFGGLLIDDYSQKHFPDVLLPDNSLAKQTNYLNLLKTYPICIATKGLCNSNGWKIAEYVALSKSIVTEKILFEVTGNFKKDKHYLEFETPDQCVEQCVKLFEDKSLREQMMKNNWDYYQNYQRPDKIIWNTIQTVINEN